MTPEQIAALIAERDSLRAQVASMETHPDVVLSRKRKRKIALRETIQNSRATIDVCQAELDTLADIPDQQIANI